MTRRPMLSRGTLNPTQSINQSNQFNNQLYRVNGVLEMLLGAVNSRDCRRLFLLLSVDWSMTSEYTLLYCAVRRSTFGQQSRRRIISAVSSPCDFSAIFWTQVYTRLQTSVVIDLATVVYTYCATICIRSQSRVLVTRTALFSRAIAVAASLIVMHMHICYHYVNEMCADRCGKSSVRSLVMQRRLNFLENFYTFLQRLIVKWSLQL